MNASLKSQATPRPTEGSFVLPFSGSPRRFDIVDLLIATGLFVAALVLNSIGLGALEFFRHTEADRSLIAWEMAEGGDYVVPRLIHSIILTKPPLFYWITAAAINFFGRADEWVVRLPSVLVSGMFLFAQYCFVRAAGGSRGLAFFSSLALFSSATFFVLASVAEIDMTYGFLCAVSLYFCFFAVERKSLLSTLLAYAFAGLAFLTKGPPIVFFIAAAHPVYFLFDNYQRTGSRWPKRAALFRFLLQNVLGVLLFAGIVLSWLSLIAAKVGWDSLAEQFRIEILDRVLEDPNKARGIFYYVGTFFSSTAPWSVFFLAALLYVLLARRSGKRVYLQTSDLGRRFIGFNLIVFLFAFIMLSAASGKSGRYLFPVHVFGLNLTVYSVYLIGSSSYRLWFFQAGVVIGALLLALGILGAFFPLVPISLLPSSAVHANVHGANIVLTTLTFASIGALLFLSCRKQRAATAILALALLFIPVRFVLSYIYAPIRNSERSVRPVAAALHAKLPANAVLYHIENFDRWVTFYLKHLGRETYRLTPAEAASPKSYNGRSYLFLSREDESWRNEQILQLDPSMKVLEEFRQAYREYDLIEVNSAILPQLSPHERMPTVPSKPFYNDKTRS